MKRARHEEEEEEEEDDDDMEPWSEEEAAQPGTLDQLERDAIAFLSQFNDVKAFADYLMQGEEAISSAWPREPRPDYTDDNAFRAQISSMMHSPFVPDAPQPTLYRVARNFVHLYNQLDIEAKRARALQAWEAEPEPPLFGSVVAILEAKPYDDYWERAYYACRLFVALCMPVVAMMPIMVFPGAGDRPRDVPLVAVALDTARPLPDQTGIGRPANGILHVGANLPWSREVAMHSSLALAGVQVPPLEWRSVPLVTPVPRDTDVSLVVKVSKKRAPEAFDQMSGGNPRFSLTLPIHEEAIVYLGTPQSDEEQPLYGMTYTTTRDVRRTLDTRYGNEIKTVLMLANPIATLLPMDFYLPPDSSTIQVTLHAPSDCVRLERVDLDAVLAIILDNQKTRHDPTPPRAHESAYVLQVVESCLQRLVKDVGLVGSTTPIPWHLLDPRRLFSKRQRTDLSSTDIKRLIPNVLAALSESRRQRGIHPEDPGYRLGTCLLENYGLLLQLGIYPLLDLLALPLKPTDDAALFPGALEKHRNAETKMAEEKKKKQDELDAKLAEKEYPGWIKTLIFGSLRFLKFHAPVFLLTYGLGITRMTDAKPNLAYLILMIGHGIWTQRGWIARALARIPIGVIHIIRLLWKLAKETFQGSETNEEQLLSRLWDLTGSIPRVNWASSCSHGPDAATMMHLPSQVLVCDACARHLMTWLE